MKTSNLEKKLDNNSHLTLFGRLLINKLAKDLHIASDMSGDWVSSAKDIVNGIDKLMDIFYTDKEIPKEYIKLLDDFSDTYFSVGGTPVGDTEICPKCFKINPKRLHDCVEEAEEAPRRVARRRPDGFIEFYRNKWGSWNKAYLIDEKDVTTKKGAAEWHDHLEEKIWYEWEHMEQFAIICDEIREEAYGE